MYGETIKKYVNILYPSITPHRVMTGEFLQDLQNTKNPPRAYCCSQSRAWPLPI